MCAKRQLDFVVRADAGAAGNVATVDGIPADLWQRFMERANESMPEKAPDAWASVLSEVVASVGGGGQTHTLIMTDIPLDAAGALDELAAEVDESADGLVAQLYRYAQAGALHLVRMHDEQRQPSHVLMLCDIPERHWLAWGAFAKIVDQTPESLFGLLLQLIEQGQVKVTRTENGRVTAHGDGPGPGRQEQHAADPGQSE